MDLKALQMSEENRKEFEEFASNNGLSMNVLDHRKNDVNPYYHDSTYWAYIGWCAKGVQHET